MRICEHCERTEADYRHRWCGPCRLLWRRWAEMYGPDSEPPKPFADYDDEEDELEEGERTYFPGS